MSLELDPVELGFRRPFDREVEEKLRLRNPNTDPVAFKVKTTAPKQYCVRPNSGRIEAGQTVDVSVLLQKMTEEPPMDAKCRDKFLVQSVAVSASDEISNVQAVWSNIESHSRSSIQEKKIRVSFLPAAGASTNNLAAVSTPSRQANSSFADDNPPAYSSPMQTQTPNAGSTYNADSTSRGDVQSGPYTGSSRDVGASEPVSSSNATDPTTSSNMATGSVQAAANTVAAAIPTSAEQVKAQAGQVQEQVNSLAAQASEGLRQRKSTTTSQDVTGQRSGGSMAMQNPSGVPVPLVAALCLLSFLLAYLLF